MFNSLFDMDRPLWRWIGKIPDMIFLSLCWYLCCIPIITIIPASCALFDAVSRNLMLDEKGCYKRFFRSFVRELKQGIPLTIIWLIIGFMSFYGNHIVSAIAKANSDFGIMSILYLVMMIMTVGYLGWLIPLQSRYNQKILGLHINALRFFLGRLPGTGLMLLFTALVVVACVITPYTAWLFVVAPCLIAILHTKPVEKAFQIAFPQDYEDGTLVSTEEDREAVQAISKAKQAEAEARENEY